MKPQKQDLEKLKNFIDGVEDKEGTLVTILHQAQEIFGYLPSKIQKFIAEETGIPSDKIAKIVKLNNFFTEKPKAKYTISICAGTQCIKKGADGLADEFKKLLNVEIGVVTPDGLFQIEAIKCIGACKLAPVFKIDRKLYSGADLSTLPKILESYK